MNVVRRFEQVPLNCVPEAYPQNDCNPCYVKDKFVPGEKEGRRKGEDNL